MQSFEEDVKLKGLEALREVVDSRIFESEKITSGREGQLEEDVKLKGLEALRDVVDFRIFESEKFESGREAELVNELVEIITRKMQHDFPPPLPTELVGFDDHVANVMRLADTASSKIQTIVIYGIGGIDITKCPASIVRDSEKGINMIRISCAKKKVLILLDDVDCQDHLDKLIAGGCEFGSGSKIIITCRDKDLLKPGYKILWDEEAITVQRSKDENRNIEALRLDKNGIKELPESIGELNKLKILRISHSEIEKLPSAIGKLESLQELDASGCHKLEGQIPEDIGGLSSLKSLRLGRAKVSLLPEKLYELSTLDHLDLLYCSELQSLPEPPFSLSSLQLTCWSHELPLLSHLRHLKKLALHPCMSLQSITTLPPSIRKLRVWKCPNLETLSNLSDLEFLLELELVQCYGLKNLYGLKALKSLRKLDVSTSTELSNLDDFEDLESLRYLDMQSYDGKVDHLHAIGGLGRLKYLEVLNISARKHIRQLDLSNSKDLKQLIVNNCKNLDKIDFHNGIKSLERFDTDGCQSHIISLFST
ncbi:hypothetical protein NL676_036176 [Syzygium grande]|nr:hypothetical protein NL676_036176 [Syzygium grande]